MKNKSLWLEKFNSKKCEHLHEDIKVDVLIVGGGITGVSVAYHLKDSGLKVALVERNECGLGVTSKTTGKLTYLQAEQLLEINKYNPTSEMNKYINSQVVAINLVKEIIKKEKINCNLEEVNSVITATCESEIKKLNKIRMILKNNNRSYEDVGNTISVSDTYVFHPLKYLAKLKDLCIKSGVSVFENSNLTKINKVNDYYVCSVNRHLVKTKKVVLATHYPYFLFPFMMPLKCYLETSFVSACEIDQVKNISQINIESPITSLRYHRDNQKNYLIFLYQSKILSSTYDSKEFFCSLLNKLNRKVDYLWSNKDIMTFDGLPFIGRLTKDDNPILIGTGYNTWGMTNGSLAGKILSDMVLGTQNKYEELFSPLRSNGLAKLINYPFNIVGNAYSWIKSHISRSDSVKYEKRNGKSVAIYTDETGKEHIVCNKCPHMKCGLIFNEVEKTWDCKCHGSRFDLDGKVIEGPSNYDVTFRD